MGAFTIYGPDNQPLLLSTRPGTDVVKATASQLVLTREQESEYATEIAKRVRSRTVTMAVADRERGRPKPTPVTYGTLRLMARRNEWVRAIIQGRKNRIGQKQWSIKVKDEDASGAAAKAAKQMTKLLTRPRLHGSQPETTTFRQMIGMYVEDLLTLDRACIEKERDGQRVIKALYNVDGATIRPNLDDRGAYDREAYIQIVQGVREADFGMEDLVVGIENPQTDVDLAGYGLSPLETLIVSVTADLHAAKFNADYFEKGSVPEGILNLGEDVDPDAVDAFRLYWLNEVVGRPWALPIIGGSKAPEFMQWRQSNRDMQFMEYQQWLLQKIAAVFQSSPKEYGQIDDVNRSTAEDASQNEDEKGLQPILAHIKEMIDLEIIGEHGNGLGDYLEFEWEQAGETADQINQKFQPMHQAGVATGGEWRDAHGMDAEGDPKATHGKDAMRMHLKGDGTPMPSKQDADVTGAAALQDREDDQAEQQRAHEQVSADQQHQRDQQQGGEPTNVPWKPADGDDPDVQQAMQDHDRDQGIGVRNVSKTSPGGDRHPALTDRESSLDGVFEQASAQLIEGLAAILGDDGPVKG